MCNLSTKMNNLKMKKNIFFLIYLIYTVSMLTIDIGVSNEGDIFDINIIQIFSADEIGMSEHIDINRVPAFETSKVNLNPMNDILKQNDLSSQIKLIKEYYFIPLILILSLIVIIRVCHFIDIILSFIIFFLEKLLIFIQNNDGKKRFLSSDLYLIDCI